MIPASSTQTLSSTTRPTNVSATLENISQLSSIPTVNVSASNLGKVSENSSSEYKVNLTVASLNIRGQTGLDISKQKQIEAFIKINNVDILHCQEIEISELSFESCSFIASNFEIIPNNSPLNKYGTATFVRNDLKIENLNLDTNGHAIVFDIGNVTFGNVYLHSGNDRIMRNGRETYLSETIPQLLTNSKSSGIISGDFNCIIEKQDATRNPENKISPSLKRLCKAFSWTDSFRKLFPLSQCFSRYYDSDRFGEGATRIDRTYHYGDIIVKEAQYVGAAFSDHLSLVTKFAVSGKFDRLMSPKSRPLFKANPDIVKDQIFKDRLQALFIQLREVKVNLNLDILTWWEDFVKPNIKKLLIARGKEVSKEKRGSLNLLLIRQAYLIRKVQQGIRQKLAELKLVQSQIQRWYSSESEKVKLQSKIEEVNETENVRIYHHEIHQKRIKKSAILKLQVDENTVIDGHKACAAHLEGLVAELLHPHPDLDTVAQDHLLAEVLPVFTQADNDLLTRTVTKDEVQKTLGAANLHAAPGSDGITSFLYKECWETVGDDLTEVVKAIHDGNPPTKSQRTSLMVFGTKPKKAKSLKPSDKRKISLLNADFKLTTGIFARRFKDVATHTISPSQLAAGSNRRIHHGINKARDAVLAANSSKEGVGLLDNDYKAAFDFMVMIWVFKVLLAKGISPIVIDRLKNIYKENITVVVVNNILGRSYINNRWSMRQGDLPSVYWFSYGIDPLINYLEKRLKGITIYSTPTLGPTLPRTPPLPHLKEVYRLIAYVDDVKPAITSMNEFLIVDRASLLFENASGCELHRDPTSGKVKFLPLGRWRGTLQQEDIPLPYIKLSDHLDMVGVVLKSTFIKTRKANCDELLERFGKIIGPWKSGKFMPLSQRPWSINSYALPKIWFRCHSLELRAGDFDKIISNIKSWLYSDLLEKPEELALFRPKMVGGLGVQHVKYKAMAILIRSFIESAVDPKFINNLYHNALYRFHVVGDNSLVEPAKSPYYSPEFFNAIKLVSQEGMLNVVTMSTKQWYRVLIENNYTMELDRTRNRIWKPLKCETKHPEVNWERSWRFIQQKGLDSSQSTFLFKLLHDILPTSSRLFRMNQRQSPVCPLCESGESEDCTHALLTCDHNSEVNNWVLDCVCKVVPNANFEDIRLLNLDIPDQFSFPMLWCLSNILMLVWELRINKKSIQLYNIRAEMECRINILRKTRLSWSVPMIETYLNL